MDQRTLVIVGAGVVGCAVAAEAARSFSEVYLIEAMPRAGMVTSTRNSGVIHSGIYYRIGSLKASHCVRGNHLLREFCGRYDVPWRDSGKLVVATAESQVPQLEDLRRRGEANGVGRIQLIDGAEARRREPHVACVAALRVPSAAIVQAEALVQAYLRLAQERGAAFAAGTQLLGADPLPRGRFRLRTTTGDFETDLVVNCAGLHADALGRMFGEHRYTIYPCRGEYCRLSRRCAHLIRELVYPLPTPISLGIHLTRAVDDVLLVGPTARFVEQKDDYEGDLLPPEYFWQQTREFLPHTQVEDFTLAYSGLRPKLTREDPHASFDGCAPMPPADFVVERDPDYASVIHLIGIESPGLTSAPALAETVGQMLRTGAPSPAAPNPASLVPHP